MWSTRRIGRQNAARRARPGNCSGLTIYPKLPGDESGAGRAFALPLPDCKLPTAPSFQDNTQRSCQLLLRHELPFVVKDDDLAQIQLTYTGFDLGEVSDEK